MRIESNTPVTFSREERVDIREMLTTWDKPSVCPRCEGSLRVEEVGGEPFAGKLYVSCEHCYRTAFIPIQPRGGSFNR